MKNPVHVDFVDIDLLRTQVKVMASSMKVGPRYQNGVIAST